MNSHANAANYYSLGMRQSVISFNDNAIENHNYQTESTARATPKRESLIPNYQSNAKFQERSSVMPREGHKNDKNELRFLEIEDNHDIPRLSSSP